MGHMICTRVFPNNYSEKKIAMICDEEATYEGDYHHGLCPPIVFHRDIVLKNIDEAQKWVEEHDRHFYDSMAVRYKEGRKINWYVKYEYHV